MKKAKKIFLVAGEASADLYAAKLVRSLKTHGNVEVFGVGGDGAIAEGLVPYFHSKDFSIFGLTEWLGRFSEVFQKYRALVRRIRDEQFDCAVLIDMPDMNFLLAKHLKQKNVPVIYYVSPQLWAWRKYRINHVRRYVDKMLVLFPFEKDFYHSKGIDAEFVGHPLAAEVQARGSYREQAKISHRPRVAVLPGSRRTEIELHSPLVRDVLVNLRKRFPDLEVKIPVPSTLNLDFVKEHLPDEVSNFVLGANAREVLAWSDVALVASGTATLETSLVGTPFCLFYRVGKFSEWVVKTFVSYRGYIGIPNLLAKKEIVREFVQWDAVPEKVSQEVTRLIEDTKYRETQVEELHNFRNTLDQMDTAETVSRHVIDLMASQ